MDGNLYQHIHDLVHEVPHVESLFTKHSDRTIVLVLLRAKADGLSLLQASRRVHWNGYALDTLPSQPTLHRRSRRPSVLALLSRVEQRLREVERVATPASTDPPILSVDGRALDVGPYTRDPDIRLSYGTGRFEKGYKFHAVWGPSCLPLTWQLHPMNAAECTVAKTLFQALPQVDTPAFLLGDAAYDINYLYAAARQRGWQLLAKQKNPGEGLGHCKHDPARLLGLDLLKTKAGQAIYDRRTAIEREFSAWGTRPEGLNELPKHVRRLHWVTLHVRLSLTLNAVRILMNKNILRQPEE
jgi:hypothetical protein